MSDFSYSVARTDDYLFGIAQDRLRDNPALRDQLMDIEGVNSEQEAAGRYAMIIAAVNNLDDMDVIYLGSELTIPPDDVAIGVMSATSDVERNPNNLRAVYDVVEPAYRNGGKEDIQRAVTDFNRPRPPAEIREEPHEPAPPTIDAGAAQALVTASAEYYVAASVYRDIIDTLPPEQRKAAGEALRDSQNIQATIAEQFPDNQALQNAAARVESAAQGVDTALASDGLGKETTPADSRSILANLRVSADADREATAESAERAVRFAVTVAPSRLDAQGIMAHADRTAIEASLSQPAPEVAEVQQAAGASFRLRLEGQTNFSFTDLAELPLNDAQYRDGRDTINASGGMNARAQLGRLRNDVEAALEANGIVNPTEKQITQASAYILAVENGEDRRGDRITDTGDISIPSTEETNAAIGVFAPAMMAANGKKLDGGEQRDALEDVQAAVTPNVTADGVAINR